MTNTTKSLLAFAVIAGVFGAMAYFGVSPFISQTSTQTVDQSGNQSSNQLAGSTAGSTFGTRKVAQQIVSVTSSTTFSILNSDTSDRTIASADMFLTGGASTSTQYAITCATSTSATQGIQASTNPILAVTTTAPNGWNIFGTTTAAGAFYVSSSSPGITGFATTTTTVIAQNNYARIWKAASYLNCVIATANGSVSNLFDSGMVGYIGFSYYSQ